MSPLVESYHAAAARGGEVTVRLMLAGRPVLLNVAGKQLADFVVPAFAHLRHDRADLGEADFSLYTWDAESTGVGVPNLRRHETTHFLHHDAGSEITTAVERNGRSAVVFLRRHSGLPEWEYAHPLRRAIGTWARLRGLAIIHAAVIGDQSGAAAVTGPGGSGKSTTALAWIAAGGRTAGDDYAAIEPGLPPIAHSVFATMRLHLDHAARFSGLLPGVDRIEQQDSGRQKGTVNVAALDCFMPSMPLKSLLLAHVGDGDTSRVSPMSPRAAMLALMKGSMAQSLSADVDAGAGLQAGFRSMAELCRSLPCGRLEIGGDPFRIPEVIRDWLAAVGDNPQVSLQ